MESTQKDIFISRMCWIGISIIIVCFILYYFVYVRNLESRECSYMDGLYYKLAGSLRNVQSSDPNCGYTFKDYYIKTSYNCCSGGSYKNDVVSTCVLKDVLRQGVRGLDFEVYSLNDEPVIATSTSENFYVKETYNSVLFSDAMSIIRNYAFSNSTSPNPTDPIILHLRIKSNNEKMYDNLAKIFKYYDDIVLGKEYSFENQNTNLGDVPLLKLCNKIVIIVDRNNSTFLENKNFMEYVNMTSNSMFMRALHFYDIKFTPDLNELQEYNKRNMTIAMPDVGYNPPNPSGIVERETGCQMLAMRYQLIDSNLKENTTFFDNAGYAFVLKPERLRYIPVTVPTPTPQKPELSYATRTVSSDYYKFNI